MRGLFLLMAVLLPLTSAADSNLPFMKDIAGDRDLPLPWGASFDFYTMDQDYGIKKLEFDLPGVTLGDPSQLKVTNEVMHFDVQADVWLLPFLNVFGLVGRVDIKTLVDFSEADIQGLPISLSTVPFDYKGTVFGGGFTLAYGTEKWFSSVTTTFTSTSTSGDLKTSVHSTAIQPKIGLLRDNWQFWVGGMYLKTDEKHSGAVPLPVIGNVPFEVELETKDNWNYAVGVGYTFSKRSNLRFEVGLGNRTHTLFNFNVRF